jgi:hypothetical protein
MSIIEQNVHFKLHLVRTWETDKTKYRKAIIEQHSWKGTEKPWFINSRVYFTVSSRQQINGSERKNCNSHKIKTNRKIVFVPIKRLHYVQQNKFKTIVQVYAIFSADWFRGGETGGSKTMVNPLFLPAKQKRTTSSVCVNHQNYSLFWRLCFLFYVSTYLSIYKTNCVNTSFSTFISTFDAHFRGLKAKH